MRMPTQKHYFIEQAKDGRHAVRGEGSIRAIFVFSTQQEATAYTAKLNPNDHPDVERVRNVTSGGRDQAK
jgi:hypothetical protein